jgi:hypothetical protein
MLSCDKRSSLLVTTVSFIASVILLLPLKFFCDVKVKIFEDTFLLKKRPNHSIVGSEGDCLIPFPFPELRMAILRE